MSAEVIVAIITGLVTVLTVIVNSALSGREMNARLDKAQAITQTKLDELTREVREHNNFARRMPVIEEKVKVLDNRIDKLEKKEA